MKFCRNLQRVIDITDPEWAPYWTNYKMLKKFLKAIVPPEDAESPTQGGEGTRGESPRSDESDHPCDADNDQGDSKMTSVAAAAAGGAAACTSSSSSAAQMSRNPGEVAFFKLLNSELKKAIHFFDKAQLEFEIREARVREGIDIMRKANSLMVSEKWSLMAKSLYRLYKDLLLLETYAIMTYCSFSKILKKHDKVTQHNTRIAFMKNVVNKANFTHYPKLLEMIARCESLYEEVSQSLITEGKSGLYEDERLFIGMIARLNEQAMGTAEEEGAPALEGRKEQRRSAYNSPDRTPPPGTNPSPASSRTSLSSTAQVNTLPSLVEENAMNRSSKEGLARVAESESEPAIAAKAINDEKLSAARQVTRGETGSSTTVADPPDGGKRPSSSSKSEVEPTSKRVRSS